MKQRAALAAVFGRYGQSVRLAALGCVVATGCLADHAPALVMPHPRGAPLVVDGIEVSGAVIEGDWGLYRPGAGTRTIYPDPAPWLRRSEPGGYFPATGVRPRQGRHEIESPDDRRPRPAQRYRRSWSAGGGPPDAAVMPYPPPVIEVPPQERWRHRPPRRKPPRDR